MEIDDTDVENAIEKMREYAGWEVDSKEHQQLRDFERTFYECVRDHVKAEYQGKVWDLLETYFNLVRKPIIVKNNGKGHPHAEV